MKNAYTINGDTTTFHIIRRNGDKFDVLIDTEDLHIFEELDLKIHVSKCPDIDGYYAEICQYLGTLNGKAKYKTLLVHRLVMKQTLTINKVDHKSHTTLDNRKYNLRVTVQDKNLKNRSSKNSNNKSGYRNVFWSAKDERWLVVLQVEGKSKCCGRFKLDKVNEAGALAEEMRQKYYGVFAGKS